MSDLTRRNLCLALPALGLVSAIAADAVASSAQTPVQGAPGAGNSLSTNLTQCMAFPFDKLPLRYSDGGAQTRDIARGTVPTGELIELHETTIGPGKMPHAAHKHDHEEFLLVREGTIDFLYNGESHILGPGGVGYTAPGQMHGFRNVGLTAASYFIFSLSKK